MGTDEYTVAIPTHFRPTFLEDLLESLLDQTTFPSEILVLYPGDSETRSVLGEYEPEFKRKGVRFRGVERECAANQIQAIRTRLMELADGDIICFLDDDTVCDPTWLESIASVYDRDAEVACVGGPAIRTDDDLNPSGPPIEENECQNTVSKYGSVTDNSNRWIPPSPVDVDVSRGANMSFRMSFLEMIEGPDLQYGGRGTFEEWDIMMQVTEAGGRIVYHPDAKVYHVEAHSGGTRREHVDGLPAPYWYAYNSILFRKKHFGDVYYRSLLQLAFRPAGQESAILVHLIYLFVLLDKHHFYWVLGYVDAIRGHQRE